MENLPANFQEILRQEREVVTQWKKDGVLEQLFKAHKKWCSVDI